MSKYIPYIPYNIYIYIYKYIYHIYHVYQVIPLHSYDYLCKVSIKINVATDEGGKSRMKSDTEEKNEIGVAVQSSL